MGMKEIIKDKIKDAMRAKAKVKLETLRALVSAIQYEEISKSQTELNDNDATSVLKREVKKRQEELEYAEKSSKAELSQTLKEEIQTIEDLLPKQLSAESLSAIVKEYVQKTPGANMGVIMKLLKESHNGQYDSKMASEIVKQVLG